MESYYTRISDQGQIDALKGAQPAQGLQFHFSLFFASKAEERRHLIGRRLSVLYVSDGMIDSGNIECIDHKLFKQLPYDEFVKKVTPGIVPEQDTGEGAQAQPGTRSTQCPLCGNAKRHSAACSIGALEERNKVLQAALASARGGLRAIATPSPSPECPVFYAEADNLQRIARTALAETETVLSAPQEEP